MDAWNDYDPAAPEELDLPEAVQFQDVLDAPSSDEERRALVQEYEEPLPGRISDEMLQNTNILEIMRSKGRDVFVDLSRQSLVRILRKGPDPVS